MCYDLLISYAIFDLYAIQSNKSPTNVFISIVQGFPLVLLKVMLFRERVNLTLRQNNLCHFSNDTDPFDGQCIKV